jgi:hypothetical protein
MVTASLAQATETVGAGDVAEQNRAVATPSQ